MSTLLVPIPKVLTSHLDSAFDQIVELPEVDLKAGMGSDPPVIADAAFSLTNEQTVEIVDFGVIMTEALTSGEVCDDISLGLFYADGTAADADFFVAAAKIARTAGGVGGAKGTVYSVLRGNGAQGASGTNFAWTAAANTQAERRVNSLGMAPANTAIKGLGITVYVKGKGALTTGKVKPFVVYKVIKSAWGEYES